MVVVLSSVCVYKARNSRLNEQQRNLMNKERKKEKSPNRRATTAFLMPGLPFLHPISAIQQVDGFLRDRNWAKPQKRVYLYLEDVAARPPVLRGRDGIISWARASVPA